MATLITQSVTRAGVVPTYGACAAGGDRFTPDKDTFLHVKNGSAGALTVTVAATAVPAANVTTTVAAVSIPANSEKMLGPYPSELFAASDGLADITYSGVTTLTIAVVRVAKP